MDYVEAKKEFYNMRIAEENLLFHGGNQMAATGVSILLIGEKRTTFNKSGADRQSPGYFWMARFQVPGYRRVIHAFLSIFSAGLILGHTIKEGHSGMENTENIGVL